MQNLKNKQFFNNLFIYSYVEILETSHKIHNTRTYVYKNSFPIKENIQYKQIIKKAMKVAQYKIVYLIELNIYIITTIFYLCYNW